MCLVNFFGLSQRRHQFETGWDCQRFQPITKETAGEIPPGLPLFFEIIIQAIFRRSKLLFPLPTCSDVYA